ncbi:hypothetical protein [Brevundimonas sp.]|uniref:hypothetical protein n=1 Tax=Brevundimonas sp. TaxID=1871086 RepID=UPI002D6CF870|nr:hypothetical protein [Brevundimonas sp.]HYD27284.1 hypothetical protein [Brevundimonas sp.]
MIDQGTVLITSIDWPAAFGGAFLGAATMGLRTVLQAPLRALTEQSIVIKFLSFLSPQQPFDGDWAVKWCVDSTKFPEVNEDTVKIYSLFGNVTFTMRTKLRDGTPEKCVFVGKLTDRTLTGRWFDPKDIHRAYFGVYQVRLTGNLRDAEGKWSGWANDGSVQSDLMTMSKVAK